MSKRDSRVDAYIEDAAPFAQPILKHLRQLVHKACPKAEETIKWGMPFFTLDGQPLCHLAAFRAHCAFGFWKGTLIFAAPKEKEAMGSFGRITRLQDLPSDRQLLAYLKKAVAVSGSGGPKRPLKHKKKAAPRAPADFLRALKARKGAFAHFDAFSPSCQREYVEWIVEAKTEETRERRLDTAVDWIAEGKKRNWKYA